MPVRAATTRYAPAGPGGRFGGVVPDRVDAGEVDVSGRDGSERGGARAVPLAGAVTAWLCSPPSLHASQRYRSAPSHWGDGTATDVTDRAITVRVNGVATVSDANESLIPDGELRRATSAVRGSSRTVSVSVRPFGSVACRESSRCDGYS